MSASSSREMVRRSAFAPAVYKLSCAAGETRSHVCIAEREDFAFLIYALGNDELEVPVAVLCDCKICNGACVRIELRQVAAAGLAVEYLYSGV